MFPAQKRERFRNNTLAQRFSLLGNALRQRFIFQQARKGS
jgi:hypothetical protein